MIAPVTTAAERAAIYSFRYDVVAREQGITADPSADHGRETIIDPADETGIVLAAWDGGMLAGSVRCNLLRDGPAVPYCRLLGLDALSDGERRLVSVTSRLVVAARWRGTPLGIRLAQACYRRYRAAGLAWDYILVRPELGGFYLRLGYCPAGDDVEFPGVGLLKPLRLKLDPAYLERVRSVLVVGSAEAGATAVGGGA
jgi:hypothetical protein